MSLLYRKIPHYFQHGDPRGSIVGILNTGLWREINLISSEAGVTRGGHFHKQTEECFLILSGRIHVLLRMQSQPGVWVKEEEFFTEGDVFIVPPGVEHTFVVLEKAQWINMLTVAVDPKNADFHKYPGEGHNE